MEATFFLSPFGGDQPPETRAAKMKGSLLNLRGHGINVTHPMFDDTLRSILISPIFSHFFRQHEVVAAILLSSGLKKTNLNAPFWARHAWPHPDRLQRQCTFM